MDGRAKGFYNFISNNAKMKQIKKDLLQLQNVEGVGENYIYFQKRNENSISQNESILFERLETVNSEKLLGNEKIFFKKETKSNKISSDHSKINYNKYSPNTTHIILQENIKSKKQMIEMSFKDTSPLKKSYKRITIL